MHLFKNRKATLFAIAVCYSMLPTVQAESLEGAQLEAYDSYCPAGNQRAVWAEELPGIFMGWVKLVCLNEDEQETSSWYITPEGEVVLPDEAELPVYVRPFVQDDALDNINALANDESIQLWLDFVYDEPEVPSLEFYGGPSGSYGSSGSATTGPNGSVESSYEINGESVTEAEYMVWQTSYLVASRAQNSERDRLIRQQVELAVYDLVERNQWHDSIDVDAINNEYGGSAFWQFNSSLVLTLTGQQARQLLQTSEGLVYVSSYAEATTSDGYENTGGVTADLPIEVLVLPANDEVVSAPSEQSSTASSSADASVTGGSSGGAFGSLGLLIFTLGGLWRRYRRV